MKAPDLSTSFEALTGHQPLRWQTRLFYTLCEGKVPSSCDLPTGLGKTAVIPIWLAALALSADTRPLPLPRRLVYVVDRRTVVDQATDVVNGIRERLQTPDAPGWSAHADTLRWIADRLRGFSAFPADPLAVSTLRGELADNGEWKADPARPAVVIGTIDMIGSRLLFSGYGDGRYHRPHHAGLLGQDTLIVHDEAHLTPAFDALLRTIEDLQASGRDPRPIRVLSMSATIHPDAAPPQKAALALTAEDEHDPFVSDRLNARKTLHLHDPVISHEDLSAKIAGLALAHSESASKVLVYVTSPKDAHDVKKAIAHRLRDSHAERVALLTGTIRGKERDELVRDNAVYQAFLDHRNVKTSVYLVSTSAGEVGNDFDADHMVCDVAPLDSLIQRLGRVNRSGGPGRSARIDVVPVMPPAHLVSGGENGTADLETGADESEKHSARSAEEKGIRAATAETARILDKFGAREGMDASPAALRKLIASLDDSTRRAVFRPSPRPVSVTDITLDILTLTSAAGSIPGLPDVSRLLRGIEPHLPETVIAWREEVDLLQRARPDADSLEMWLRRFPLKAQERLRAPTADVSRFIKTVAARSKNSTMAIVLRANGGVSLVPLSNLARSKDIGDLEYRTIILPNSIGGLGPHGMLDPGHKKAASDVADADVVASAAQPGTAMRERWLVARENGTERFVRLTGLRASGISPPDTNLEDIAAWVLENGAPALPPRPGRIRAVLPLLTPSDDDDGGITLDLIGWAAWPDAADDDPENAPTGPVQLADHAMEVAACASRIAAALGLDRRKERVLTLAAWRHDEGKKAPVWQRYARAGHAGTVLAKSSRYLHPRALGGYRHEAGSLVMADLPEPAGPEERDMILHLIAAHHGWGRPHFDLRAWASLSGVTSASARQENLETARRFSELQARLGRWGLAWLESLLRCADAHASAFPDAGLTLPVTPSADHAPSGPAAPSHELTLHLDHLNPGHFFACCGLLEITHRLRDGVTGRFSDDGSEFVITHHGQPLSLRELARIVAGCSASENGNGELVLKAPDAPLRIVLNWWTDGMRAAADGPAPKTWAGHQNPKDIVAALQLSLRAWGGHGEMLDYACVLRKPPNGSGRRSKEKLEPFYFDARRFTNALDEGFSLNDAGMEADAFPAVELLALIGLQRFRPARRDDVFSYHIWRDPLCLSAAPAAVAGIAFSWRRYTFEARRRDHKNRYYKGFCPAPPA